MNIGILFLKVNTIGSITISELDWIANNQSDFNRLDMALVIKLGRLMDKGVIEIDCRLPAWFIYFKLRFKLLFNLNLFN